jgi:hypothetical protein
MKHPGKTYDAIIALVTSFCLFINFMYCGAAGKDVKYISLEEHIVKQRATVQVKSVGGHTENCVVFEIQNLTADSLFVWLEPGRRLVAKDSVFQDILIVKERNISISPLSKCNINGYGFCCQSSDASPKNNSEFYIGYIASPEWIRLANLINVNNFPAQAIQNAVWVLSNNHSISSIYYEDVKQIKLLRATVAAIKGIEDPWYSIKYENDTAILFSNKPERLFGEINYYLNKNATVTINVRNRNGALMKTLIKDLVKGPGNYDYELDLEVKGWPNGDYQISFYEDNSNLIMMKKFTL